METATARIPVLVTNTEKARIVQKARAAGLSTGEYMRRAAASFHPSEDDKALEAMIDQMLKATARADQAIENALKFVAESNKRIAVMESNGRAS